MRSPTLAAPVMRGRIGPARLDGVSQSIDFKCILECGTKILTCAPQCLPNPLNPGCISCLGSSYEKCKNCF